jgi:hypothetical protein
MPRLSKIGAAALAAFGWTGLSSVTASYLQVAGGGGGGFDIGGGGGAGGYLTGTTTLNPTLSYTVTVGAGGAGSTSGSATGVLGSNSQFDILTASVGGGGGGSRSSAKNGANGGSGGGGSADVSSGGTGTSGQGNAGGSQSSGDQAAGGGGASAAGAGGGGVGTGTGNGGDGTASSITGTSVTYAGGGGGGSSPAQAPAGTGGAGGGGAGSSSSSGATAGTANLGGGGGGGSNQAAPGSNGANGGSGVVIISYPSPQKFGGGVVTVSGANTIHTFQTSGTLSPLSSLTASALVVAGGGGGGANGGGGGAGGYRTGSGITLDTNSTYLVTVGAGGIRGIFGTQYPTSGSDSVFNAITSTGGGYGADGSTGTNRGGGNGGSGGGGFFSFVGGTGNTPSTSPSQGNNGGDASPSLNYGFGGGGGASAAGATGTTTNGGNGGAGTANSISGASVTYAGGGGGGIYYGSTPGAGGAGGGGAGGNNGSAGTAGTANTGGGGGGGGSNGSNLPDGGAGGSGIIIVSYASATQLMAGGTVTISGGNVIHTFTSSGYLTPLTLVGNSLRFRASASAYLNRTPPVASNRKTWTWSAWVKRGTIGSGVAGNLFQGGTTSSDTGSTSLSFFADKLYVQGYNTNWIITNAVYRDPSAWYHVVLAMDSTQATGSNRLKLYINGSEVSYGTYNNLTQNTDYGINQAASHVIGQSIASFGGGYFDGYLTEVNFIDGQALTPNSFGTFNSYGVWQPIRYGGSYGTNGFYLPFNRGGSTFAGSFNGTSQVISAPANAAFNFTGNFTAECWYNTSTVTNASQPTLFTIGSDASGLIVGFFSGTFYCYMLGSGGLMTAATPLLNQWVHVAWVRVSGVNTLYLNGVASATASVSGTLSSTGGVTVGRTGSSGSAFNFFQGSVSNFRVTNYAVYTGNFVPPTSALTAISGTQLLTLQSATIIDNSTNAFTITNTGSVTTAVSTTPVFANRTTLTADQSPAGNNWTANSISVTTGVNYDSMADVPTLTSTTAANYCTLNPLLAPAFTGGGTLTQANLRIGGQQSVSNAFSRGTMAIGDKAYAEIYWDVVNATASIGIVPLADTASTGFLSTATTNICYRSGGNKRVLGTDTAYGASWVADNIIGVAVDPTANTVEFFKNGVSQGVITSSAFFAQGPCTFALSADDIGSPAGYLNCGQRPFTYTPPTGFLPLNTFNL